MLKQFQLNNIIVSNILMWVWIFERELLNQGFLCLRKVHFSHRLIIIPVTIDFFFFFYMLKSWMLNKFAFLPQWLFGSVWNFERKLNRAPKRLTWEGSLKWERKGRLFSFWFGQTSETLERLWELWDSPPSLSGFQHFGHLASLAEFNGLKYSSHLIRCRRRTLIRGFYWTDYKSFWISQ